MMTYPVTHLTTYVVNIYRLLQIKPTSLVFNLKDIEFFKSLYDSEYKDFANSLWK